VDEGNNWINVSWGPLALTNPSCGGSPSGSTICGTKGTNYGSGPALANYNLTAAINNIPANQPHPLTDFYGNLRPEPGESTGASGRFDSGAIEFGSSMPTISASLTLLAWTVNPLQATHGCNPLLFGCPLGLFLLTNTGNVPLTGIQQATVTGTNASDFPIDRMLSTCGPAGNGQLAGMITLQPQASCLITAFFAPATAGAKSATLSITDAAGTQTASLNGTGL